MSGAATTLPNSSRATDREDGRVSPIRGLIPFLLSERLTFTVTLIAAIGTYAFAIATGAVGAWIVGAAADGRSAGQLVPALVLLAGIVIAAAAAAFLQSYWGHDLAFLLLSVLRIRAYDGLERAAPGGLLGRRTGDLTATVTGDVETLEGFFAHLAGDYIGAVVVSILAVAVLAVIQPIVALITVPFMLLVAVVPFLLASHAGAQGRRLRDQLGVLNAEAVDGVQGLRELVIFGRGPAFLRQLIGHTRAFQQHQLAYGRRAGVEQAVTDALLALGLLAVLVGAAQLALRGELSLPYFPVAVVLAVASLGPIVQVTGTARHLGEIRAAAARVLAIVHQPPLVADTAAAPPAGPVEPRICFRDVHFRYMADREQALRGVDFEIAPGETVALVGHSGAGKSTCTNLLVRFWDPDSGRITIGGHDVRSFPLKDLRGLVMVVPQDVYLFHTSVRDNIRLGRPEATDEEAERAARLAVAHDFIAALPNGYDTVCGERGAQLSGGQRQRVAIARALIKRSPILVMDEAVSNLDAESEQALQTAMRDLRRGLTTLLIAHRLSTIRGADRIIVLEHGAVAETGTHDALLRRTGAYARLIAGQRGGMVGV